MCRRSTRRLNSAFARTARSRPFVVHRIDQDTSGLVVFAKDPTSQHRLKPQFAKRQPERIYLAVVYGHPEPARGLVARCARVGYEGADPEGDAPARSRGSEAIADYRVVETFREAALIEVRLRTGRRNQIRIQARLRGHTLVGEQRYVFGPDDLRPIAFGRQALHAFRLEFDHPTTAGRWRSKRLYRPTSMICSRLRLSAGKWLFGVDSGPASAPCQECRACETARFVAFVTIPVCSRCIVAGLAGCPVRSTPPQSQPREASGADRSRHGFASTRTSSASTPTRSRTASRSST